jgi:hypothetical protein
VAAAVVVVVVWPELLFLDDRRALVDDRVDGSAAKRVHGRVVSAAQKPRTSRSRNLSNSPTDG